MSGFDDLLNPGSQSLMGAQVDGVSKDLRFSDADTLVDDETGQSYRLQGIDAPEVAHGPEGTQEIGGRMTTEQVIKLANSQGFTRVVVQDQGRDAHGRQVVDLQDKNGRSFRHMLASTGVVKPVQGFDETGVGFSAAFGRATREGVTDDWSKAADAIRSTAASQQRSEAQFKQNQQFSGDWQLYVDALVADGMNKNAAIKEANRVYNPNMATFEYADRDVATGKADSPLGEAWDSGWTGVQEGLYGFAEMAGDTTGWDALRKYGTAGIERKRADLADQPHYITDFDLVKGEGDNWAGFISHNLEALTTNAAMSLPYMAITIGASVAAPFTGGASLAAPASVYAGQTWNEMEGEKSAAVAVTSGVLQATLDRLGIGAVFGKLGGKATKEVLEQAATAYAKKNGVSLEAARTAVARESRLAIASLAGDAAQVAKQQIAARQVVKGMITRAATGAAGEGSTEALQEATAYLGATIGSDKQFDANELIERMQKAAIAGSVLGTAFSAPGTAYDYGAWLDVAVRQAPAEAKRQSDAGRWAEQEVKEHGRVQSIAEINEENRANAAALGNDLVPLDELAEAHHARQKEKSTTDRLIEAGLNAPALWRGSVRHAIPQHLKDQSRSLRKLSDMLGGQLQRTFSGASYENEKFHRVAIYKNMTAQPDSVFAEFNDGNVVRSRKQKGEISDYIYTELRKKKSADPRVEKLRADFDRLGQKMWQDQKKHNPDLGHIDNYLGRYKSLNKRSVAKNRDGFIQALQAQGVDPDTARQISYAITDNAEVNDFDEAFSTVSGQFEPGSHKRRSLDLSEKDAFDEFFEKDIFANVSQAVRSAARYTAHQDYIGDNGKNVAALLHQAQKEGVDPVEIQRIAARMKDIIDAEAGNFKRAKTEKGKAAERIQKNFMFVTLLAGLPLSTVSSFVELGLSMRGLTQSQVFGKGGGLATMGREFANTMWRGMGQVAEYTIPNKEYKVAETPGKAQLRKLGFYEWDVGAATVTGATEINPLRQKATEEFFKWNGLQGWTNYTRAIRASMAFDYITDKLDVISAADPDNPTNEVQEAREALRNIGVNIEDMLAYNQEAMRGPITPEMDQILQDNIREGTFNFVNDAVALPQAANRPLIYQDPRFALFTQFQGFIATFTANHIPKLWGEYVKRGTPAMKYNAFAIMTTMIMLGFASQYLKDLIKYGLTNDEDEFRGIADNPYLEPSEVIQRGIRSSGLLGSGERLLDQFAPLYEQRDSGGLDWAFKTLSGESPTLSNIQRAGKSVGKVLEGETGEGVRQGLKAAPFFGPFSAFGHGVKGLIDEGDWNYKVK